MTISILLMMKGSRASFCCSEFPWIRYSLAHALKNVRQPWPIFIRSSVQKYLFLTKNSRQQVYLHCN